MEYRTKQRTLLLTGLDLVACAAGYFIAYWLMRDVTGLLLPKYSAADLNAYPALLLLSFVVTSFLFPQTNETVTRRFSEELPRVLRFVAVYAILFAGALLLVKSELLDSRYLYVTVFAVTAPLVLMTHALYARIMKKRYAQQRIARLVGVVTTRACAENALSGLAADPTRKAQILILTDVSDAPETLCGTPCIAGTETLTETVRLNALDELLLVLPYERLTALAPAIGEIESMGVVIHAHLPLLDLNAGLSRSTGTVAGYPVVSVAEKVHDPSALALKRLADLVGGTVGLVLSVPIVALVAIPLLIESPGKLFFSQTRLGRNGRPFRIYKVRSMYPDAEARKSALMEQNEMQGPMFKMKRDPRITKVGRFIRATSIDELPQFLNVVLGDMSLVGPRPPLPDEFMQYLSAYKRRLSMRPGITGLWQISGRNQVPDFDAIVRMDLDYIDNWSLRLDAKILMRTVVEVLKASGE